LISGGWQDKPTEQWSNNALTSNLAALSSALKSIML
jgi:hypothetical protein